MVFDLKCVAVTDNIVILVCTWLRGTVVERWYFASKLSLCYAQPAVDRGHLRV